MGEAGWGVTLVTPGDGAYLTAIEKLINKQIEQKRFPGFELPAAEEKKPDAPPEKGRTSGLPRWTRPARRRR
ncbi:MAG: hypothetical protein ACYTG6_13540 [Planctomycetota bacterium]|jgi:hypothetical protein